MNQHACGAPDLSGSVVGLTWLVPEEWRPGGRPLASHRGELQVVRINLDQVNGTSKYAVSGYVTNQGGFIQRVFHLPSFREHGPQQ
jgi:hypothetical protein